MNMFKSTHQFLEKKEAYELPSTRIIQINVRCNVLTGSNGENLTMRAYGTGAGEEVDGFWD